MAMTARDCIRTTSLCVEIVEERKDLLEENSLIDATIYANATNPHNHDYISI